MTEPWLLLEAGIEALGVRVDPGFETGTRVFLEELGRWSRVSRLTGYRSVAEQVIHLILDSLLFLVVIPEPAAPVLDIGSGPGVPGLVLKLARPAWSVTLVEANRRRANFMRHVVRRLGLDGAEVREERAEALAREPGMAAAFRTVTMRAVAEPAPAMRLAGPFLAPTGHAVIALGPCERPLQGAVRRVSLVRESLGLRIHRAFLIIPATESQADVPRETRGGRGPRPERREPERRGRQDDHGSQSRRGPGRGGTADPPRGSRPPG